MAINLRKPDYDGGMGHGGEYSRSPILSVTEEAVSAPENTDGYSDNIRIVYPENYGVSEIYPSGRVLKFFPENDTGMEIYPQRPVLPRPAPKPPAVTAVPKKAPVIRANPPAAASGKRRRAAHAAVTAILTVLVLIGLESFKSDSERFVDYIRLTETLKGNAIVDNGRDWVETKQTVSFDKNNISAVVIDDNAADVNIFSADNEDIDVSIYNRFRQSGSSETEYNIEERDGVLHIEPLYKSGIGKIDLSVPFEYKGKITVNVSEGYISCTAGKNLELTAQKGSICLYTVIAENADLKGDYVDIKYSKFNALRAEATGYDTMYISNCIVRTEAELTAENGVYIKGLDVTRRLTLNSGGYIDGRLMKCGYNALIHSENGHISLTKPEFKNLTVLADRGNINFEKVPENIGEYRIISEAAGENTLPTEKDGRKYTLEAKAPEGDITGFEHTGIKDGG